MRGDPDAVRPLWCFALLSHRLCERLPNCGIKRPWCAETVGAAPPIWGGDHSQRQPCLFSATMTKIFRVWSCTEVTFSMGEMFQSEGSRLLPDEKSPWTSQLFRIIFFFLYIREAALFSGNKLHMRCSFWTFLMGMIHVMKLTPRRNTDAKLYYKWKLKRQVLRFLFTWPQLWPRVTVRHGRVHISGCASLSKWMAMGSYWFITSCSGTWSYCIHSPQSIQEEVSDRRMW